MNLLPLATRNFAAMARYHRHSVVGLENIPAEGAALIVANHSFATYDSTLLWLAIRRQTGRTARLLADRALFRLPLVRDFIESYGTVEGSPKVAAELLRNGELMLVNPGGMRESLLPSSRRYELDMDDRKGFVRLAIETQTPVILSACPAAEEIYYVHDSAITRLAYEHFKLPVPIARGLFNTPLPKRVTLTHYLSRPITPPACDGKPEQEMIDRLHGQLVTQLQDMMHQHSQQPGK